MQIVKISKWGNSQGIRIPKDILKQIGIENADTARVSITVEDRRIVIASAENTSKLMTRFSNYDYEKYLADKDRVANLGNPVGRELW